MPGIIRGTSVSSFTVWLKVGELILSSDPRLIHSTLTLDGSTSQTAEPYSRVPCFASLDGDATLMQLPGQSVGRGLSKTCLLQTSPRSHPSPEMYFTF